MEQTYQNYQQPAQYLASNGMSPETEKLLNKWLKMQITQYYWGGFFRFVWFLFIAGMMIYSTITLAPFLNSLLGTLQSTQSVFNSMSGGTYGIENKDKNSPASSSQPSINDIIKQLSPEQKKAVEGILNSNN